MALWRPMRAADLNVVAAIADIVHVDYPERPEVFADRLALFAAGCLIAEEGGRPLGYCISHPGVIGHPPPLDTVLGLLPEAADCLYLHDVALLPEARGRRLGVALARLLEEVARAHGFGCMALTAVNNSDAFWQAQGFVPQPCAKLASYGEASYRVKRLGGSLTSAGQYK
jgi:GNAT superfamily N-acetyltransferase